jgi:hypothetical protein
MIMVAAIDAWPATVVLTAKRDKKLGRGPVFSASLNAKAQWSVNA